jgi:hypothetical protein
MEILQNSLKKADLDTFTPFQMKVWNILNSLLKHLMFDKLSEGSLIEKGGIGIDVFLRLKSSYFILYMSIQKDNLVINSEHFDIYVYHETEINKIELLLRDLLLGKYFIKLGYGSRKKLVYQELVFDNKELEEFNEKNKFGFFTRKIINEKRVEGVKLIHG